MPVNHWFRGWFKINLSGYDISNCLNKNLITQFVWYLDKEKRYGIETFSVDRVLSKERFMEKSYRNYTPKASSKPLLNFGKWPKTAMACKEIFKKIYILKDYQKALKKN